MSENQIDYGIEDSVEDVYDDITDLEVLIDIFGDKLLEGINGISDIVGKIHALSIVGVEPKDALDYVFQLQVLEHEKLALDESNKTQLEVSKIKGDQAEKMEM